MLTLYPHEKSFAHASASATMKSLKSLNYGGRPRSSKISTISLSPTPMRGQKIFHEDKVLAFKPIPGEQVEVLEPKGPPEFKRTNTNDLMAATFPTLKAIVPGYVY